MDFENIGTTTVENAIAKTDYLVPYIKSKEKGPIWDGEILVYNKPDNNNHANKDLLGRVPVQIKGHKAKYPYPETISYPEEVCNLQSFLWDGGVIYFVVCFDEEGENEQIYYKILLPYDIKKILKSCKGQQKSTSFHLRPFPSGKNERTDIFYNFLRDKRKQDASISNTVSIKDMTENGQVPVFSFGCTTIKKEDAIPYMMKHGTYLYAKGAYNLEFPIEHFENIQMIAAKIQSDITIGSKLYYDNYTASQEGINCKKIQIGKSITFTTDFSVRSSKFIFDLKGTLSERIRDLTFVIAMLEYGSFSVSGTEFKTDNIDPTEFKDFHLESKKKHLENLMIIQTVLDRLHVQDDLNMDAMTETDMQNLDCLIDSVYDGKWISLNDTENVAGLFNIANLHIFVFVQKDSESGLFKIIDFFDPALTVKVKSKKSSKDTWDCPSFVFLTREILLKSSNISPNAILRQIDACDYNEICAERIVLFLLEVLLAFDSTNEKNSSLMNLADMIMGVITQRDKYTPHEIVRLNELQIIKRKRQYNVAEISELTQMSKDFSSDDEIVTGVHLLLGNQREASLHYFKMSVDKQKVFSKYPIFRFWNTQGVN